MFLQFDPHSSHSCWLFSKALNWLVSGDPSHYLCCRKNTCYINSRNKPYFELNYPQTKKMMTILTHFFSRICVMVLFTSMTQTDFSSGHEWGSCFSPQGQEVVWRRSGQESLCWSSSMTSWWTTTSWSWPGSCTWTPTCCTAHAGMCFSQLQFYTREVI